MPIPRPLVAALALMSVFAALVSPAQHAAAASCSGNSHALTLSDGGAAPGSGTTDTKFKFSVTYTDNDGCAPDRIAVVVMGVDTYNLNHVGGAVQSGAVFAKSVTLPAGSWAYRFEASSGSGAGRREVKLTKVQPARVIVAKPSAGPTQQPVATPAPTPRRTAAPSTSPPTPRPSASAGPTEAARTFMPTPAAAPATVAPSRAAIGAAAATPSDPGTPIALLKLLVASAGTVGGLILFAALGRRLLRPAWEMEFASGSRRRRDDSPPEPERRP